MVRKYFEKYRLEILMGSTYLVTLWIIIKVLTSNR